MNKSKIKELITKRLENAYQSLLNECTTFEAMVERAFRMSYILNLKSFLDFAVSYDSNDTAEECFFEVYQVILGLEKLELNWFEQIYHWALNRDASFNMDSFEDWNVEFQDYYDKFKILEHYKKGENHGKFM